MSEARALDLPDHPRLTHNITHFARALRKAGLRVGPGRVIDAIRAVEAAGFTSKEDFFFTLQACFVSRAEDRAVFAQVFRLYWRDPRYMEPMMAMLLPALRGVQDTPVAKPAEKRAAEALLDGANRDARPDEGDEQGEDTEIDIAASMTNTAMRRGCRRWRKSLPSRPRQTSTDAIRAKDHVVLRSTRREDGFLQRRPKPAEGRKSLSATTPSGRNSWNWLRRSWAANGRRHCSTEHGRSRRLPTSRCSSIWRLRPERARGEASGV